jgi:hypothetical protein
MSKQYNEAIICITHAIVLNNAGGVARALMQAGYERKSFLQECEMELLLLQVFLLDRKKYFEIMHAVDWNPGEKQTNAPEIKDKLIALSNNTQNADTKVDWKHILILLNV